MPRQHLVDLENVIKTAETDKAYRILVGTRFAWVPKSQCQDNGDGTFTMPIWLAEEKELI